MQSVTFSKKSVVFSTLTCLFSFTLYMIFARDFRPSHFIQSFISCFMHILTKGSISDSNLFPHLLTICPGQFEVWGMFRAVSQFRSFLWLLAQSCCRNVWKGHIFQTVFKSINLPLIHWPPAVQFKPVTMCWCNTVPCEFKLNHSQHKHAYFLCKLGLLDCFLFANCLVLLPPRESRWQIKLV